MSRLIPVPTSEKTVKIKWKFTKYSPLDFFLTQKCQVIKLSLKLSLHEVSLLYKKLILFQTKLLKKISLRNIYTYNYDKQKHKLDQETIALILDNQTLYYYSCTMVEIFIHTSKIKRQHQHFLFTFIFSCSSFIMFIFTIYS